MTRPAAAFRAVAILLVTATVSSGSVSCLWLRDLDGLEKDVGARAPVDGSSDIGIVDGEASDADAEAPFDGDVACPSKGGAMVRIRGGAGGADFCIDSTEVAIGHYRVFQAQVTAPGAASRPECAWNTAFNLANGSDTDDYPVRGVDWCDAIAFCEWAGKRLCGRIGGGQNSIAEGADAAASEWFRTCSRAGERRLPYGDSFEANRCVGGTTPIGEPEPVKNREKCVGGYANVFDMSGNLREWEDSCDQNVAASEPTRSCLTRGGAFYDVEGTLYCDNLQEWASNDPNPGLGIRCCADAR